MADKIVFKLLTVTDYEEEEQFLREQHQDGWKFCKYWFPGFYFFDKCMREDVVYRLDFEQVKSCEKTEYLQLYQDFGWEYLFDVNGFSYFRKPAGWGEGEPEIFNDNESRVEMVNRVFKYRMIPLLIVFFCCVIPQLILQFSVWYGEGGAAAKGFTVFFFVMFVAYLCLFIHCGRKIRSLRSKYGME